MDLDKEQIFWVKQILGETPDEYKLICFSHDAPFWHAWIFGRRQFAMAIY